MNFIRVRLALINISLFLLLFTACQLNSSKKEEGLGVTAPEKGDTLNVTNYSVKNETSDALKDWKSFAASDAVIFTPADWKNYNIDGSLVLMPINSAYGYERISFNKYAQDLHNAEYDKIVQKIYHKAFINYTTIREDKMKKLELEKGIVYEKNVELMKGQVLYKGYFLVYKNQTHLYEYSIALTQSRLNNYDGSLMQDIAGNLSVGGNDIFGSSNPIKKIIILE